MDNKTGFVSLLAVALILLSLFSIEADAASVIGRGYRFDDHKKVFQRRSLTEIGQATEGGILAIDSILESRFAVTTLGLNITNTADTAQEVVFSVQIPLNAFITYFSMEVNGILYVGQVVTKEEAQAIYDEAKSNNQTTGLVENTQPKTQTFAISTNVGAGLSAKFTLIYKMLLTRKLSRYEYLLYIPEKISRLSIDLELNEPSGLYSLESPSHNSQLTINKNSTWARVSYGSDAPAAALTGPVVVRYTIGALLNAGNFVVNNNFFVHWFSPSNLPAMPKSVVLIIDTSGSMDGTKIAQAKAAASTFVSWLDNEDKFNIVSFSDIVTSWQVEGPVTASTQNKDQAQGYINSLSAGGSTNINDAVLTAIASQNRGYSDTYVPIIILLTDGEATAGETYGPSIRSNIVNANENRVSTFCLGFGYSLDYELLRLIAYENNGFDRRIIDDETGQAQLEAFFAEINKPIMTTVNIAYSPENNVADVTQSSFKYLFEGSEIIVAGRIEPDVSSLDLAVTGSTKNGPVSYTQTVTVSNTTALNTEVVWAYWTVQQLISQYEIQTSLGLASEANDTRHRATELALEYQFVTPFTSMVVVQNNTVSMPSKDPNNPPPGMLNGYPSSASAPQIVSTVSVIVIALTWFLFA